MSWAADADATWQALVEDLLGEGFQLDREGTPFGDVPYADEEGRPQTAAVEITRGRGGFPFAPPRVRPFDGSGRRSWHQERDGTLCLFRGSGNADLPWLDVTALLAQITRWLTCDAAGWAQDPPDLDLERYLVPGGRPEMVLFSDIEDLVGKPLRFRRRINDVFEVTGTGVAPAQRRPRHSALYGHAIDVGELARPFHGWDELAALLDDPGFLEKRIRSGRLQLLLVRYERQHLPAVAAMQPVVVGGSIELRSVESAGDSGAVRVLRAGSGVDELVSRRVAVVGVGAVGSFLADLLVRRGLRRLTLMDGERLRPGNCVRHLLGHNHVGQNKAVALANNLVDRHQLRRDDLTVIDHDLITGEEAESLLTGHDLVINATASDLVSGLLNHLADTIPTPVLSVHLERYGELVVLHRRPLPAGRHNRDLAPDPVPRPAELREGGCGDPVSPTPPHAVVAAAVTAVDVATSILIDGADAAPATLVHVRRPQPDTPFDVTGTLEW